MNNIALDRSQRNLDTQIRVASVATLAGNHAIADTQAGRVSGVIPAPDHRNDVDANVQPSGASTLGTSHNTIADTHRVGACPTILADHVRVDNHELVVGSYSSPTKSDSAPKESTSGDILGEAIEFSSPSAGTPLHPYLYTIDLGLLAQQLDDYEELRKAQENRLRIFTRTEEDADGEKRGFGLDEDNPVVITCQINLEQLKTIEHKTVLELQKAMRRNPLNEWRKTQLGIGEKTLARLLDCIGDPFVRMDNHMPRTVSQLWAFCGLHTLPDPTRTADTHQSTGSGTTVAGDQHQSDTRSSTVSGNIAARRMKGVKANWSTKAKTRSYLLAEACVKAGVRKDENGNRYAKNGSEYAQLYIDRRNHTAVTHPEWTPLHSQNDALRIVSKRILRNLWRAARDIHMNDKELGE